jgi:Ca2+-binding EF-hand superfamily protein
MLETTDPKEAKDAAKALLADQDKFDKEFEKIFKKYDTNLDKHIDEGEYYHFVNDLLKAFGRKPFNFNAVLMNFERADKNKDASISKDEFKVELKKKLNSYASS